MGMEVYNDIRVGSITTIVKKIESKEFKYVCPGRLSDGYLYVTDGEGVYINHHKQTVPLAKHTLLFLMKDQQYTVQAKTEGFAYITTGFSLHPSKAFEKLDFPEHIDLSNQPYICQQFDEILKIWEDRSPWYLPKARIAIEKVLIDIMEEYGNTSSFRFYGRLYPVLTYIHQHYDDNITNEKLADICGLSVTHFRRIFKEQLNKSPMEYLTDLRINWALKLLKTRLFSVSEVGTMVGFPDVYYFSKLIKKYTGNSPTKYIKTFSDLPEHTDVPQVKP